MAQQTINVGAAPNDGTGTPLRTAFQYTNSNFSELYTATGPSGNNITVPGTATITGDLTARTTGLTVNSSGVGIGTNLQSSFLGNSPKKLVIGDGTQTPALTLYGGSAYVSGLYFADGTVGNQAYRGFVEYDHNTDSFALGISGSLAMTLNSTGLGVGGSVVNKLTVTVAPGTTTSDGLRVTDSSRSIGVYQTGATYSYLGIGGNQNLIYTAGGRLDIVADSQSLFLRTGTNSYLNLDTSGNVGIGVTPINRLTVAGNMAVGGTGNNGLQFHSGSPVSGNLVWWLTNDQANSNILNLYYYSAGVFSGRAFVVNQSGNFMVRTPATPPTIPDNEMMVFNLTSNTNLRVSVKGTDGVTRVANITLA